MLDKEINLNKKFIIILLFLTVITLGMYSSYAYYEVSVIKNSVIVLKTAEVNLNLEVVNQKNNTFTIPKNDSITVTINLTSTSTSEIGYKLYYILNTNNTNYVVTSIETFNNNAIEGTLTSSKQIALTFTNNSNEDISITLGANGGLKEYPMVVDKGEPLMISPKPLKDKIVKAITNNTTSTCNNLTIEEDEITYLSGTNDCINFNYVWYSGKLWRITAINKDGTMKMITDDPITTISYGSDVNFYDISKKDDTSYTGSYVYQFLNEDFLDTLYNYKNIIVEDSTWNITATTSEATKLPETTLINSSTIGKNTPVGLLNSYEYYLSYKNTSYVSGYLRAAGKYGWWLLNKYDSSKIWLDFGPFLHYFESNLSAGIRPSIILKSGIENKDGEGTLDNPYRILGDKEEINPNTTLLNTRTSGEYVIFDEDGNTSTKEIYRIVGFEDGKTKLNKNDYIKISDSVVSKNFSTSIIYGNGTSDDYWDYYLNNSWHNSLVAKSMLDKGTYYIKEVSSGSYKNSICNINNTSETTKNCEKTTNVWNTGYVGLPRYGEMFASYQENSYNAINYLSLITPSGSSKVWCINQNGAGGCDITSSSTARPSIYLKSNVVITGGNGTKNNPFTIALKN